MSRFKCGFVARLAAVTAVSAFLLVGCGDDGDDGKSGNTDGGGNFNYGELSDSRDGKSYKTIKIGDQTWMAENLNYQTSPSDSWCYGDNPSNCNTYGRLYTWNAAMSACPSGWHLPTHAEWRALVDYIGGLGEAGTKLKTSDYGGTNNYGFSALPSGAGRSDDGSFHDLGSNGNWWTATEVYANDHYFWFMGVGYPYATYGEGAENAVFAVRCLQD
jgi:uncharacterized protein (TIGR02145 family)